MKVIKYGKDFVGFLSTNATVNESETSLDNYEEGEEIKIDEYIVSTIISNGEWDKIGDLKVVDLEEKEAHDKKGVGELKLLLGLSKEDLKERISLMKSNLKDFAENGIDPEDYERVVAVYEVLQEIYKGILSIKEA